MRQFTDKEKKAFGELAKRRLELRKSIQANKLFVSIGENPLAIRIRFEFDERVKDFVKSIKGSRWNAKIRVWEIPFAWNLENEDSQENIALLTRLEGIKKQAINNGLEIVYNINPIFNDASIWNKILKSFCIKADYWDIVINEFNFSTYFNIETRQFKMACKNLK